jgi:peptidoglycan hydrolase-like protein with peptidoglycan-binding domain
MQLQSELRQLGFTIPQDELRHAYLGPGTCEAVLAFQRAHSLPENGLVDVQMAATLTDALAAQTPRRPSAGTGEQAQASTSRAPAIVADSEPAVLTQPLPSSAHPAVPSGPSQPAPSCCAPLPSGGSAGSTSAVVTDGLGAPIQGLVVGWTTVRWIQK